MSLLKNLWLLVLSLFITAMSVLPSKGEPPIEYYPIDYHTGLGTGRDGSTWYYLPFDAPTVMKLYERTLVNGVYQVSLVGTGATLKFGKSYVLNVVWTHGYIPMNATSQPQYFAKVNFYSNVNNSWSSGSLSSSPFNDTAEAIIACLNWPNPYPWDNTLDCYRMGDERVFATQYRLASLEIRQARRSQRSSTPTCGMPLRGFRTVSSTRKPLFQACSNS